MIYNSVSLAGYLIKEPEIKSVGAKNTSLCTFCLGVQTDKEKDTVFMDCTAWGKSAEALAKYTNKGSNIFVVGELVSNSWQDKNTDQKRTKTTLNVKEFKLLDPPPAARAGYTSNGQVPSNDEIPF